MVKDAIISSGQITLTGFELFLIVFLAFSFGVLIGWLLEGGDYRRNKKKEAGK